MYNYKVFLPTAGIGSRVKGESNNLNKCLISIDNKPVISHIIEKFHSKVSFVVALGYGGDYVKQFLEIAYPDRDFVFVNKTEPLNIDITPLPQMRPLSVDNLKGFFTAGTKPKVSEGLAKILGVDND